MAIKDTTEAAHLSAPTIPRVPWNPWLGVVFMVVVYILALFLAGYIVLIGYELLHHSPRGETINLVNNSTWGQFVYVLLAEGGILGSLYLFVKKLYDSSLAIIGLKRPRWRDIGFGLLAVPAYYVLYLLAVGVVTHFVPSLNVDQQQQIGFTDVQGFLQLAATFVSLVVLPPLTEEIMFRGFLYGSLKKGAPTAVAVIATSLIFASLHLAEGGSGGPLYIAALDTFILSLVLIYLREKTGSLWASITLHSFKNFVAFTALFIFHVH